MATKKVFLRDATGLVRQFTAFDALILTLSSMIGPAWPPAFASFWYLFPGVSIPASLGIICIFAAFNGLYYVLISAVMPRSGGGSYIPLSRTVHPALAMGMSFILAAAISMNLGFVAYIVPTIGMSGPLVAYGILTNSSVVQSSGALLSTPIWGFIGGTAIIILVGLVMILGTQLARQINKIAFAIATLTFFAMIAILLTSTQQHFQAALESFAGQGTYANIINTARSSGWNPPADWVQPTLVSLPLAFFAVLGYAFTTYYAGEIRQVSKNMMIAVIGGIIYYIIILAGIAFLMQQVFGSAFITSAGYLFNAQPGKYPLAFPPWVSTFIVLLNSSPLLSALMIASFVSWGYLIIVTYYLINSRHFLAWSFDRTVPAILGSVSDRFHSPIWATVVTGLIAWIALVFYSFLPAVIGYANLGFMFIVAVLLDGLAGAILPWSKKNLFELAPPVAKKRIAGIPVISILGVFSVLLVAAFFALSLVNPIYNGPFGVASAATVLTPFLLGVAVYYGMKIYWQRHGLDIGLAFKDIPPE